MIQKHSLVPLKEMTVMALVAEMERLMNTEATNPHPAIKKVCRKKMDAILYLIEEDYQR